MFDGGQWKGIFFSKPGFYKVIYDVFKSELKFFFSAKCFSLFFVCIFPINCGFFQNFLKAKFLTLDFIINFFSLSKPQTIFRDISLIFFLNYIFQAPPPFTSLFPCQTVSVVLPTPVLPIQLLSRSSFFPKPRLTSP